MTTNTTNPYTDNWLSKVISIQKSLKRPKPDLMSKQWLMARMPNGPEAFTTALGTSFGAASLGDINRLFGSNPVSKIVLRDATKAPPVVVSAVCGFEVGTTGYNYDTGYVLSSMAKVVCKGSDLFVFHKLDPHASLAEMGSFANFPCDALSRFFVIVGQKRKDAGAMDANYFYFMSSNFDFGWISAAWHSSASKNLIMDSVGGEVGKSLALVSRFNRFGDKIIRGHNLEGFSRFMALWGVNFGADLGNTLVLTWPGRVAQDGSGALIDNLEHEAMKKGLTSCISSAWEGFIMGSVANKLVLALRRLTTFPALQERLVHLPNGKFALGGATLGCALALALNAPKAYEAYKKEMNITNDRSRAVYDATAALSGGLVSFSSDVEQCINTHYTKPLNFIQQALLPLIKANSYPYVGYSFYTNADFALESKALASCYTTLERIGFWISGRTLSAKLSTVSVSDGATIPESSTCLINALKDPGTSKKHALTYVDAVLAVKNLNNPQKVLAAAVEHKSPELAYWALSLGAKCENLSPAYVAKYCERFVNSWCEEPTSAPVTGVALDTNPSDL